MRNELTALTWASLLSVSTAAAAPQGEPAGGPFRRIASFPVYLNTDVDSETVAEIVSATDDGNTLVYSDSENANVGFVDITDPSNPQPDGIVALAGEPTAVSVAGAYALVGVNTSADFINTSGQLDVVDIATRMIVRSIPLGGQPDSVAVSPDGRYAAVVIENERDEDLGDGEPPQLPAGFLVVVDITGDPATWTTTDVSLTGVADLFPEDPEPEFVDINGFNIAAVSMQENNHMALVDLATASVIFDFPMGSVDLTGIDTEEEDLIDQSSSLMGVPREPDAIAWVSPFTIATANEGDLLGGSRGFSIFTPFGIDLFDSGNSLEHGVARIGHYPENRSGNKGNEPEGVEFGRYGMSRFLFVGSERSNVVFVYRLMGGTFGVEPVLVQVLPAGVGPEGLLAIPSRDLFVVANEVDGRDDKIRSTLMIYERNFEGDYPSIQSVDRVGTSVPIPWGALSALAVSPTDSSTLYTVHDSFYTKSRAYQIDNSTSPATITKELPILDSTMLLGNALRRIKFILPGTDDFEMDALLNGDGTINLDFEGFTAKPDGTGFWAVSEGAGNLDAGVSDEDDRPFESPNLLLELELNPAGDALDIVRVVGLPFEALSNQLRFGLEGVTVGDDGAVYVCFQRAWQNSGDPADRARIGRFDPAVGTWGFAHYPLDAATSPNGGWVGLSEIVNMGDGRLAVLERDNQGNTDAAIKRVYSIDATSVMFRDASPAGFDLLSKTLEVDVLATGVFDDLAVLPFEKLEGMAIVDGDLVLVNDNDGIDDNSGETRLIVLEGAMR